MNDLSNFNTEVNKHLKDKFKSKKWSGVCPKFYKNDIPNLIKCIEIRKLIKQDGFYCFLSVYSNFNNSNSPKGKMMYTNKQIFLVTLTPDKVTDSSYVWPLKDDKDFNTHQINLLWEAILRHGEHFFTSFNNFPNPFLDIKPIDFNKGKVKLFSKYEVFSQVNYMNFLKEIHVSLNQIETATTFSNLAIKSYYKNLEGKNIIHNKTYKKAFEEYLRFLEMPKLKNS